MLIQQRACVAFVVTRVHKYIGNNLTTTEMENKRDPSSVDNRHYMVHISEYYVSLFVIK